MQGEKSFLVAKLLHTFLNPALHSKAALFVQEKVKLFLNTSLSYANSIQGNEYFC